MQETLAGIDVGDGLVTAARAQANGEGRVTLVQAGWEEYPDDADDRRIAQAVRTLWKRQGFPTRTVAASLRSQSVALKHFQYSGITDRDVESAVHLEAEEALQTSPDRICVDWHVLSSVASAEQGPIARDVDGFMVAAPKTEVDRHVAILRSAGLYPVVLDVGPMAISNLFLALRGKFSPEKTACIVNLGRRVADIAILFGDSSVYPRTIVSRAADWEEALDYLATNIQDVLKYCQFKLRRESVRNVLVCGRAPGGESYVRALSNALDLPAQLWNPLDEMTLGLRAGRSFSGNDRQKGTLLAGCLGLSLRKEQQ